MRRAAPWLIALVALLILVAVLRRGERPERPERATPEQREERPAASIDADTGMDWTPQPRTTRTGAEVFGINEGLALPLRGLAGRPGARERSHIARRAAMVRQLGVGVVRANSHAFPKLNHHDTLSADGELDWEAADLFFELADELEMELVVVIGPWPGTRTGMVTREYVPEDMDAYVEWVEQAVERYGDTVLAWELDNEPDLHNSEAPKGAKGKAPPRSFQTPAEYAEVALATSAAIRRIDADATILLGGMYRAHTPKGATYLEQVWRQEGIPQAVDAISLHCYFRDDALTVPRRLMRQIRELAPQHPVWVTETSVPSSLPGAPHTSEQWQARMLVALHGELLAHGVNRIFWHTLVDATKALDEGPVGFRTNSLYATEGEGSQTVRPKASAEVYARLVEVLSEESLDDITLHASKEGRMLELDGGWLVYTGELPVPAGSQGARDLMTGEDYAPQDSVVAPAWVFR